MTDLLKLMGREPEVRGGAEETQGELVDIARVLHDCALEVTARGHDDIFGRGQRPSCCDRVDVAIAPRFVAAIRESGHGLRSAHSRRKFASNVDFRLSMQAFTSA